MQKKTVAIISDSFAGLILAAQLQRDGHLVTLIDTGDCLKTQKLQSSQRLTIYPLSETLEDAIDSLNTLLVAPVVLTEMDVPPLTFDDGSLKPFMGFGASKSDAVQPLSRLNSSRRYELNAPLEEKLEAIVQGLKVKHFTYSEISQIEFSASQIAKVTINGSHDIIADQYVFLNSPREILAFVPADNLGARIRARIMKSDRWARVALEIQHSTPLFAEPNLLFLIPHQDDQAPCVGQFLKIESKSTGEENWISTWETYLPTELSDDAESVAATIKNMRKLVKRAFADLEDKPKEFITVTPNSAADFAWLMDQKESAQIADNLVFYPTIATPFLGLSQSVVNAHSAYTAIKGKFLSSPSDLSPSLLAGDASC